MTHKANDIFEAWGAFFMAHALSIKRIDAALAGKASLSLDEYSIMLVISRSVGQKLRYSALATSSIFTKSGITRLTSRLEQRGFLRRVKCKEDGRGAFAEITTSGHKAMQTTWNHYSKAILDLLTPCLNQNEAKQFKVLMEKLIDSASESQLLQINK